MGPSRHSMCGLPSQGSWSGCYELSFNKLSKCCLNSVSSGSSWFVFWSRQPFQWHSRSSSHLLSSAIAPNQFWSGSQYGSELVCSLFSFSLCTLGSNLTCLIHPIHPLLTGVHDIWRCIWPRIPLICYVVDAGHDVSPSEKANSPSQSWQPHVHFAYHCRLWHVCQFVVHRPCTRDQSKVFILQVNVSIVYDWAAISTRALSGHFSLVPKAFSTMHLPLKMQ